MALSMRQWRLAMMAMRAYSAWVRVGVQMTAASASIWETAPAMPEKMGTPLWPRSVARRYWAVLAATVLGSTRATGRNLGSLDMASRSHWPRPVTPMWRVRRIMGGQKREVRSG